MSAKILILSAILAVAKAAFLGSPAVVIPSFGRQSTTVYHGSALAYHPNNDYRAPQTYNEQYAVRATPMVKSDDNNPRDTASTAAPVTNSDARGAGDNANFDNNSAFSYSYNQKDIDGVNGRTQSEKMDERATDNDNSRRSDEDNRYTNVEFKTSTTSPVTPAPTQAIPAADKLVLVTAPAFYHATPVTYHAPLAYDSQVSYHGPIAHNAFSSVPVGKFAYSTSQISYNPNQSSTLFEDCLTCPQA